MKKNEITKLMDQLADIHRGDPLVTQMEIPPSEESLVQLWQQLPLIEPSTTDQQQCERFAWLLRGYAYAARTSETRPTDRPTFSFVTLSAWKRIIPLATAAALAVAVTVVAMTVSQTQQLKSYGEEIRELKNWMAQSSPPPPESVDRIEAMYLASEPANHRYESPWITEDLLYTLRSDPAVNVRLSAIHQLEPFAHDPLIRKKLLDSIRFQRSETVILELSQVFLGACERDEIPSFLQMIQASPLDKKWLGEFNFSQI